MRRLEAKAFGAVQGVLFRVFVRRAARGLDVVGVARNLDDGSVEVTAEGNEAALKVLLSKIHEGSFFSRVDRVESRLCEATGEFSSFYIA